MSSVALSIVVPVFNVEEYISFTIESIRRQVFTDWQLILVDDGSTDSTPSICDKYSTIDSRIIVTHIENSGPGRARNVGVKLARGKYITFVDGDDEYASDMTLEKNMSILKSDSSIDVLQFPYEYITIDGRTKFRSYRRTCFLQEKFEVLNMMGMAEIEGYLWHKIFKADLFHKIRFREDIILTEDLWFMIDVVMSGAKFYISHYGSYRYFQRKMSLMNKKRLDKEQQAFQTYFRLLETLNKVPEVSEESRANWYMNTLSLMVNINAAYSSDSNISMSVLQSYIPKFSVVLKPFKFDAKIKYFFMRAIGYEKYLKTKIALRSKRYIRNKSKV